MDTCYRNRKNIKKTYREHRLIYIMNNKGYIYCLSNPSFFHNGSPFYKIGKTERQPDRRADELYRSSGCPTSFNVEFAIPIDDIHNTEILIHSIFKADRLNPKREFFTTNIKRIQEIFGNISRIQNKKELWWNKKDIKINNQEKLESKRKTNYIPQEYLMHFNNTKKRTLKTVFKNNQRIRHVTGELKDTWIGKYNSNTDKIEYNLKSYNSISDFAQKHIKIARFDRPTKSANGWVLCDIEINNKWYKLKDIITIPKTKKTNKTIN